MALKRSSTDTLESSVDSMRIDRLADGEPDFDDAALQRVGDLVERRTLLYSRAWQFAVAGGTGFAILVALATIH
jgi:hypothetical protein